MKKSTLITVLATIFFSCVREKGVSCGSITISTDWGNLSKAVGMSLIFYPENGDCPIRYEITPEGCTCTLPEGKYKVLLFNNDTKNIQFRNLDHYDQAEASVIPVTKSPQMTAQPDMLYGSSISEILIEDGKSIQNKVKISSYTKTISANINITTQASQKVKEVSAQLKGISSSINLSKKNPVHETTPCCINMDATLQSEGNVTVSCVTFGSPLISETPNPTEVPTTVVEIAAAYNDDTQKTITADITKVIQDIQNQENENTAIIELRDLGLTASVVNWTIGTASGSVNK